MFKELSVLVLFGICSWEDIKNRQIHIWWIVWFAAEGVFSWIFLWKQPAAELFKCMLPGIAILLLGYVSQGNIGAGDGMLLIVAGMFLGTARIVSILVYATFFSAGYALYLYLVKKKSKEYEIPFIPFLLGAFIVDLYFLS